MYRVERENYVWQGNYYNPTWDGYEWNDIEKEFNSEDEAIAYVKQIMDNPFISRHRVVHNGNVVATFFRWQGKVEQEQE